MKSAQMRAKSGVGSQVRKGHGQISKRNTLEYNKLREHQNLNATHM